MKGCGKGNSCRGLVQVMRGAYRVGRRGLLLLPACVALAAWRSRRRGVRALRGPCAVSPGVQAFGAKRRKNINATI